MAFGRRRRRITEEQREKVAQRVVELADVVRVEGLALQRSVEQWREELAEEDKGQ